MTCGSAGSRRLISGYAGRTPRTVPEGCGPWAHPRLSGEGAVRAVRISGESGSSPHARGGQPCAARARTGDRLIPACAGRAPRWKVPRFGGPAHPRMRGEGVNILDVFSRRSGSSPHARGGQVLPQPHIPSRGLIPACAGRASSPTFPPTLVAAHPRMRGEGAYLTLAASTKGGSSPHARGGRVVLGSAAASARLIPACAGRAAGSVKLRSGRSAHPRMRGEGEAAAEQLALGQRLIPACAGRASPSPTTPPPPGAHPRMRGEGSSGFVGRKFTCGSSPHARGGR